MAHAHRFPRAIGWRQRTCTVRAVARRGSPSTASARTATAQHVTAQHVTAQHISARRGRLLVECLIAMLLINTTALVSISLARSASASAQRARLTTAAWGIASVYTAPAVDSSCAPVPNGAIPAGPPPLAIAFSDITQPAWVRRDVIVTAAPSPWLRQFTPHPMRLTTSTTWACP